MAQALQVFKEAVCNGLITKAYCIVRVNPMSDMYFHPESPEQYFDAEVVFSIELKNQLAQRIAPELSFPMFYSYNDRKFCIRLSRKESDYIELLRFTKIGGIHYVEDPHYYWVDCNPNEVEVALFELLFELVGKSGVRADMFGVFTEGKFHWRFKYIREVEEAVNSTIERGNMVNGGSGVRLVVDYLGQTTSDMEYMKRMHIFRNISRCVVLQKNSEQLISKFPHYRSTFHTEWKHAVTSEGPVSELRFTAEKLAPSDVIKINGEFQRDGMFVYDDNYSLDAPKLFLGTNYTEGFSPFFMYNDNLPGFQTQTWIVDSSSVNMLIASIRNANEHYGGEIKFVLLEAKRLTPEPLF